MNRKIAFFDFDGTITKKDSLLAFIRFTKGPLYFFWGFFLTGPFIVAYKLGLISNQKAKEKVLQFFFSGMEKNKFDTFCSAFSTECLPRIIRASALQEIDRLRRDGFDLVIVSASPENWIKQWATKQGMTVLGSRIEIKDNKLTGSLMGRNCHGEEKSRRILDAFCLSDFEEVYAYGDTAGDKAMLRLAKKRFFKPFV